MQYSVSQEVVIQLKNNVMMPEGVDRKNGAERWAVRLLMAAGYREQYVAPTGLRPEH